MFEKGDIAVALFNSNELPKDVEIYSHFIVKYVRKQNTENESIQTDISPFLLEFLMIKENKIFAQ